MPQVVDRSSVMATWDSIREYLTVGNDYQIERDFGNGFTVWVEVAGDQRVLLLVAANKASFEEEEYVTYESWLGPIESVNLTAAAQAARNLLGGVVIDDNVVSLRDSRCFRCVSVDDVGVGLSSLAGVTVGYRLATDSQQ